MHIVSSFSARFQLEIKMPQLGSTRLGKFSARARSSRKIPARTHHYKVVLIDESTLVCTYVVSFLTKNVSFFQIKPDSLI